MDKVGIIERMRERNIKWDDIGYFLNTTGDAARMCLKKKRDIEELGEKPIIKKSKFESAVVIRLKSKARENPKYFWKVNWQRNSQESLFRQNQQSILF